MESIVRLRRAALRWWWPLLVSSGGLGCTGVVEPAAADVDPARVPEPIDTGNGGPQTPPGSAACAPTAGFVPLHRLNNREYNAAVGQLFGVSGDYAANLPSDNLAVRFDNNASVQQLSGAHVEGYLRASEQVLADARADAGTRARLFACEGGVEEDCAVRAVTEMARIAFRRTPEGDEIDALLEPYRAVIGLGLDFQDALTASYRAILVAPQFLFRAYGVEGEAAPAEVSARLEGAAVRLSGTEFATRLAAFLWGSVPDAALLAQAERGDFDDLHRPQAQTRVRETIRRMLRDPRAASLVDVFFGTYLHLGMMDESARRPDRAAFPQWTASLEAAVAEETRAFLAHMISDDESPRVLLTADYGFVNRELGEAVYGLSPDGLTEDLQRVPLPPERRGILTQGTILAMTSNPDRTSIVNRGLWVMDNLMCLPTPTDAPPGVPTEVPDIEGASIRERLEAHRSDPSCATCHAIMDPLGFGLENFDAIGRFRETDDDGFPVDAQGELPDGRTFTGAAELAEMVLRSGEFETCLTRNLMEYAVGRRFLQPSDLCAVESVVAQLTPESPFSEWLFQVVMSPPFAYQRAPEETP